MAKYQSVHQKRAVKLSGILVKTNLFTSADAEIKEVFLESLSQATSVEVTTLKTITLHEFQLLEMNAKAIQNLLTARAKILERLQSVSKQITVVSQEGK